MYVFQRELCFELVYCVPTLQAWDQSAISLLDAGVWESAEDPEASQ